MALGLLDGECVESALFARLTKRPPIEQAGLHQRSREGKADVSQQQRLTPRHPIHGGAMERQDRIQPNRHLTAERVRHGFAHIVEHRAEGSAPVAMLSAADGSPGPPLS